MNMVKHWPNQKKKGKKSANFAENVTNIGISSGFWLTKEENNICSIRSTRVREYDFFLQNNPEGWGNDYLDILPCEYRFLLLRHEKW